jgi:hypothetical protein
MASELPFCSVSFLNPGFQRAACAGQASKLNTPWYDETKRNVWKHLWLMRSALYLLSRANRRCFYASKVYLREVYSMLGILWAIFVILIVLWLLGFLLAHVGGGLIHILLIVAVIVLIYNLIMGTRRRTL